MSCICSSACAYTCTHLLYFWLICIFVYLYLYLYIAVSIFKFIPHHIFVWILRALLVIAYPQERLHRSPAISCIYFRSVVLILPYILTTFLQYILTMLYILTIIFDLVFISSSCKLRLSCTFDWSYPQDFNYIVACNQFTYWLGI